MRTKLFLLALLGSFTANTQNLLYDFPFNNSLSATVGTGIFESSGTSFTTDRHGNPTGALSISQEITAPLNLPIGDSSRTVSLWFKRAGTGDGVFSYGSSANLQMFGLYFDTWGNLIFQGYGAGNDKFLDMTVIQNMWYHLAVSYDGTSVKTYLNGQWTNTYPLNLNTGSTNPFKLGNVEGHFDDLKIYDFDLSDSQVLQLYNNNTLPLIIAEYTFDNTYNNVNGNTPFVSNSGTSFTTDRHGNVSSAININNTGTIATIPNLPFGNSERTIAFWAKANVLNGNYNMTFSYGSSDTSLANGGSFRNDRVEYFGYYDNFYGEAMHIANVWYHFVYTYDGTTAKIYKDGVLVGQADKNWNTTSSNNYFRLGIGVGGEVMFNGAIDDLKIYSYDLSDTEVENLYDVEASLSTNQISNVYFKLYPNPASQMLNIQTETELKSVEIFNIQGQKVLVSNQSQINVSELSSGIYMIKITDENNQSSTHKFIKK